MFVSNSFIQSPVLKSVLGCTLGALWCHSERLVLILCFQNLFHYFRSYKLYSEDIFYIYIYIFFYSTLSTDQINWVYSNGNQGRFFQNWKLHNPQEKGFCARAWPYKSYSDMTYFFKNSSQLPANIRQTVFIEMISNEKVYKNC